MRDAVMGGDRQGNAHARSVPMAEGGVAAWVGSLGPYHTPA